MRDIFTSFSASLLDLQTTKFMLELDAAKDMFSHITDDVTHDPDYYIWPFHQGGDVAHDHGTSHLSVLAENGDAVACTSTINHL